MGIMVVIEHKGQKTEHATMREALGVLGEDLRQARGLPTAIIDAKKKRYEGHELRALAVRSLQRSFR